jgi:uncharacterized membrane protein
MHESDVLTWIGYLAVALELFAAAVIVVGIAYGTVRYIVALLSPAQRATAYRAYRIFIGKNLLLGLEVLVAGDIIKTVALEATLENVLILALLVVVRTFLSWSLVVEIEGHWPWRGQNKKAEDGLE